MKYEDFKGDSSVLCRFLPHLYWLTRNWPINYFNLLKMFFDLHSRAYLFKQLNQSCDQIMVKRYKKYENID